MTRILEWTEAEIDGLEACGLSRVLTEVGDDGFVSRELGFDVDGNLVHRFPGQPTKDKHGLFDLAKIDPSRRANLEVEDFERLWSA